MKPFFTTSHGVMFQEDCLAILSTLKPESIDMVFADPPFNIGKDYKNGFNDSQNKEFYFAWSREWITLCVRSLKPGGSLFLYAMPELALKFGSILNEMLTFKHWIALSMKGSFPRGKKLYPAHYALLYFSKGEPKTFNHIRLPIPACRHCGKDIKDYGGHRNKLNPEGLNLTDFWEDTSPNRHKKYKVRPGVNELKTIIPERAILISTNPGEIIFDPFGGGGSTYHAAEKNNRNWIGTELFDCPHIHKRFSGFFPESINQIPEYDWRNLFYEDNQDQLLRWGERKGLPPRIGRSIS